MEFDYGAQYALLLASLFAGIGFGIICDCVRACRMIIKHHRVFVFAEDLLVCAFYTLVMIIEFYNFSLGKPRLYAFIVSGLAALGWRLTVGRFTQSVTAKVMSLVMPRIVKAKHACKIAIDFFKTWVYTVYIVNKAKRCSFTKEVN